MNLGPLIRRHRKERKLTLKAVAEKAGISEGFMSQVENNVKSPSVDTLMKICNAIGVNAGDVLNQMRNQERLAVIRKQEWDDVDLPHTGFITRRFFPPENRTVIDSAILVLMPNKSIPVRNCSAFSKDHWNWCAAKKRLPCPRETSFITGRTRKNKKS